MHPVEQTNNYYIQSMPKKQTFLQATWIDLNARLIDGLLKSNSLIVLSLLPDASIGNLG